MWNITENNRVTLFVFIVLVASSPPSKDKKTNKSEGVTTPVTNNSNDMSSDSALSSPRTPSEKKHKTSSKMAIISRLSRRSKVCKFLLHFYTFENANSSYGKFIERVLDEYSAKCFSFLFVCVFSLFI